MFKSHVFSREFWRSYWIAIRRSRKDVRDRKAALLSTIWIIFALFYYGSYLWRAREAFDVGTCVIFTIFGLILLTAFGGRRFFFYFDARKTRRESDLAVDPTLRRRLAIDGFAIAVLLARSGSEQFLREKQLPPQLAIVTRRHHIDQLRSLDLWETLPTHVRSLLLMPDGSWPKGVLDIWTNSEVLRCLRWALRVDSGLTPLTHLPQLDPKTAQSIIDKPEQLLSSAGM